MGRKIPVLFFHILLCFVLFVSSVSPGAASETGDDYGPVPLDQIVKKNLDNYIRFQQQIGKKEKEPVGRGYIIDTIMDNKWLLTRAVISGYSNAAGAIEAIKSDRTLKAILFPTAQSLEEERYATSTDAASGKPFIRKINTVDDVDLSDPGLINSAQYVSHKRYSAILEELQAGGFFGGAGSKTMFDTMRFFGVYLLGVTFMAHLAFKAYSSFIESEPIGWTGWFRPFFLFMILLLFMLFLGRLMSFGLSISDAIRNIIINTPFGENKPAMQVIGELLDARMEALNATHSDSFWALLKGEASKVISLIFGWAAYLLAGASICILIILSDSMMALAAVVGPIVVALSMLPNFSDALGEWIRGYFTLLFYGPLAGVFIILITVILIIGIDTSPVAFIIICIGYIMGATQIPRMANGLTGMVLAGTATMLAWAPVKFAAQATGGAASQLAGGAKKLAESASTMSTT